MSPVDRFFEMAIVGMLASGYAGVLGSGFLDLPTAILAGCALFARAVQLIAGVAVEVSMRWLNLLTIAYVAFFAADWMWLSGNFLTATVHLLFFLAVVRLFTARSRRDYLSLQVIAFLEIIAGAIVSASTTFFIALAVFLLCAVGALAGAEMRRSLSKARQVVRAGGGRMGARLWAMTASITVGVLILTAALFFLLPRTARAAFQHLIADRYRVPGFSTQVDLGRIGELKRLEIPVMHVRGALENHQFSSLRWRGAALREFDGRRWYNPPESGERLRHEQGLIRLAANAQRWRGGARTFYEVQLTSIASDMLFIAGTPEFLQISSDYVRRMPGGSLRADFNSQDGVRYGVYTFLEEYAKAPPVAEPLTAQTRMEHLILPRVDPRVTALAREWKTPREIERHLRTEYGYTLELLQSPPDDPLAHFLFERRKGHCEYFASAMAVMLRLNGIPSRVVTGFLGGTFNPISGWQVIRSSDAHSWVEAWMDDAGRDGGAWVTFDPTPPDPSAQTASWRDRVTLWADALDTFWHDWVLNYSLDQQLVLAARAEQARFGFGFAWLARVGESAARIAPWVLGAVAVFLLIRYFRLPARRKRRVSEAGRLYTQMLATLKRRGVEKPAWMTPHEFLAQIPDVPWRPVAADITHAYYEMRFGERPGAADQIRLLLKQL